MKLNHLIFVILMLSTQNVFSADSCQRPMKIARELLADIDKGMKEKTDINEAFETLEQLIDQEPDCVSFKKLKLKDNQVALIRKYHFAPDRSFNLEEKECTTLKVDTTFMPKNNNQGPLGWCYAFTTADLISFHEQKAFSAYSIALENRTIQDDFNKERNDSYGNVGGNPGGALFNLINEDKKGICLESDINFHGADWYKVSEMIAKLSKSEKPLSRILCENEFDEKKTFGDIPDKVIKILDKLSAGRRTAALFDLKCNKREPLKFKYDIYEVSTRKTEKGTTKEDIISIVDLKLSEGQPISIGYGSDVLKKGVNSVSTPDHASTVIGRQFNKRNGQCEYEIKNSWGDEDDEAPPSIRHEKGSYWVPRTALKNNIDGAWMIEKKPN